MESGGEDVEGIFCPAWLSAAIKTHTAWETRDDDDADEDDYHDDGGNFKKKVPYKTAMGASVSLVQLGQGDRRQPKL